MGMKQLRKKKEKISKDDAEIREMLKKCRTKIKIVGAGGAGNNTISRLMEVGVYGAETIAINTDAQDLVFTDAHKKILIGKKLTGGLGAGADPKLGMEAAKESKEEIKKVLEGADMVFLTCGLGGGCLRGDSLILTNPEGLIPINSIEVGTIVYTINEKGCLEKRKVLAAMATGIKKIFEVKTKKRKIYASFDHPFLRVRKLNDINGKFSKFALEWVEAQNLKAGDLVVVLKEKEKNSENYGYVGPKSLEFFKNFEFEEIKLVKEKSEEEVFDITVEGCHNFIAEGFVVHNTGSGSLPVIAEISNKLGALTVAIVTLPFSMEGKQRMENAKFGLKNLEEFVDTLIIIPNDRLLEIVPNVSLLTAFKICDEILVNAVKGITELVTKPGLVNLDFADVKAVMRNGGLALIGLGESDTENRAIESVEKALNNPLINLKIDGAKGALINVMGGPDITVKEAHQIVEAVSSKLSEDAKIIWGAQIYPELENSIRTLLIVTGIQNKGIYEKLLEKPSKVDKKEIEKVLGVDVVR